MSGRLAAMLLIGLGLGTVAGAYLHNAAVWSGLALVLVGIGVAIVGRSRTASDAPGDPASDAPGDPAGDVAGIPAQPGPEADRPRLSGLGTRVEQILRLAEEQANAHGALSEREAEQIVANAQAEAQAIIDQAREQAS